MSTSWTSTRSNNTGVYLEPVFGRGPLPQEEGRYKHIDKELRWLRWAAVASHTAQCDTSCSTDVASICTFYAYTHCETGTGIDTIFSFHCEDSAVHYY